MDGKPNYAACSTFLLFMINRFKSISNYFSGVRENTFDQQRFNSINTILYRAMHEYYNICLHNFLIQCIYSDSRNTTYIYTYIS